MTRPPGQTADSARTVSDGAEVSAHLAGARFPRPVPTRPTAQHATSTGDVHAAAIKSLGDRGITNPGQFGHLDAEAIEGTVRWFDAQNGRVGLGVLVNELRAGGKPGWRSWRALTTGQDEYLRGVEVWLSQHFPELEGERGPHPAAVVAVMRLHQRYGKGSLTVAEHGDAIRGAVKTWEEKWA